MIAIIIGVIVTILDQITKIIVQNVKPTGSKNPGFIDFRLTYNQGAAFSFMDNNTLFLAILSLVASALIIYIILKYIPFKTKKLLHISMGLILGGCVGNLIDRFMTVFKWRKGVIDFIDIYLGSWHFPGTFNVADFFLVTGVCLIILDIIIDEIKNRKRTIKAKERLSGDDNENNSK